MKIDKPPCQRESNAQSSLGTVTRRFDLREHLEDVLQRLGGNADSGIFYGKNNALPITCNAQLNLAARIGVLGGVGQKVGQDLSEP